MKIMVVDTFKDNKWGARQLADEIKITTSVGRTFFLVEKPSGYLHIQLTVRPEKEKEENE